VAHLLMVESRVGPMSRLLPRAIREGGIEFTFLTRDLRHYLRSAPEGAAHPLLGVRNVMTADTDPGWTAAPAPSTTTGSTVLEAPGDRDRHTPHSPPGTAHPARPHLWSASPPTCPARTPESGPSSKGRRRAA
jgi:hypothetical protein